MTKPYPINQLDIGKPAAEPAAHEPAAGDEKDKGDDATEEPSAPDPQLGIRALGPHPPKSPHARECRALLSRMYRLALVRMEWLCGALVLPPDVRRLVWAILEQSLAGMTHAGYVPLLVPRAVG
jgi:hypothetical protein